MIHRILLAVALLLTLAHPAWAQSQVHRFTLVAGANDGGAERPRLQYAVADAERFARVLVDLGGVEPANEIVLREPKVRDFVDALDRLSARVAQARRLNPSAGRTEVLVYYSGHADEQGLLLGGDRYSYRSLRDRLDQIPSDVRIAVLDACASGAFTRLKSGRRRPAFLVDEASTMRGHAFLTSSAATEAAQESDRIRASYFTHYLVSGFRGAADLSGDGKVTLNEAYQFAFSETLGRTVDTKAGPQHPSYDINLSGTGDVVMTDLRQTTATLILDEELSGRFFVRNARKELIVELKKPRGRRIELGVEHGAYEVRLELPRGALVASAVVAENGQALLGIQQFGPAALETTRRRGDEPSRDLSVAGRNRFSVRFSQRLQAQPLTGARQFSDSPAIEYTRYFREDFSLMAGAQVESVPGLFLAGGLTTLPTGQVANLPPVSVGDGTILSMPLLLRWNPLTLGREQRVMKPFLAVGVVPTIGWGREAQFTPAFRSDDYRRGAVSVYLGGGLDFHLTERFTLGISGGHSSMVKGFDRPVGARRTYSVPDVGLSLGWLFGRSRPR